MQVACRFSVLKSSALRLRLYHRSIPLCFPQLKHARARDPFSDLGLRSNKPPDSSSKPRREHLELSDQDWEIRTGRAIYVLQQTLPEFFVTGLVTSMDKATGTPKSSASSIPIINANPLDLQIYGNDDTEGIYSTKVGLSYTPPVALPPPFPATLHIEGLPLYLASAVFIRHTLNALYVDLKLELTKCVVSTPRSSVAHAHTPTLWSAQGHSNNRSGREKSLVVGFCVTGISRVSGAPGEWEITSTYTFSPLSGLINKHIIDSIYPAPHQAVYDSLRTSLGKVFGLGIGGGGQGRVEGGNGAACTGGEVSK